MRKLLLAMVLALPLATIGNTTEEVEFTAFPESPFVFPNDMVDGDSKDGKIIVGPWFLGGFTIVNNHSDYSLYVPALIVKYSLTEGGPIVAETTIDMSSLCREYNNPLRKIYAFVEPNSTFYGDKNCDVTNDGLDDREMIFFEGLPESESYKYYVTVELDGFFYDNTDETSPIKGRVKKTVKLVTQ